jgi:hypothetical protein
MTSAIQRYPSSKGVAEADVAQQISNLKTNSPGARFDQHIANLDLDNALLLMAPEIAEWLESNIQRLKDALAAHLSVGGKPSRALMHLLQDLRGQAGSIGFPFAGRAAAALHRLLEADKPAPSEVLTAHIDAIKAIVVENARGADNPLAEALVEALEEFTNIWISPASGNNSESSLGS